MPHERFGPSLPVTANPPFGPPRRDAFIGRPAKPEAPKETEGQAKRRSEREALAAQEAKGVIKVPETPADLAVRAGEYARVAALELPEAGFDELRDDVARRLRQGMQMYSEEVILAAAAAAVPGSGAESRTVILNPAFVRQPDGRATFEGETEAERKARLRQPAETEAERKARLARERVNP